METTTKKEAKALDFNNLVQRETFQSRLSRLQEPCGENTTIMDIPRISQIQNMTNFESSYSESFIQAKPIEIMDDDIRMIVPVQLQSCEVYGNKLVYC